MPDHKGVKLQQLVNFQKFSTLRVKISRHIDWDDISLSVVRLPHSGNRPSLQTKLDQSALAKPKRKSKCLHKPICLDADDYKYLSTCTLASQQQVTVYAQIWARIWAINVQRSQQGHFLKEYKEFCRWNDGKYCKLVHVFPWRMWFLKFYFIITFAKEIMSSVEFVFLSVRRNTTQNVTNRLRWYFIEGARWVKGTSD